MSTLLFGSVCSGIEAASVAWHPLGWKAAFVSEIEKFPRAVLAHHYPHVPNYGDITNFQEWPDANIDVLVGGTPCQSFSVAGLRKGLADPRGNLMLTYGAIAGRYRPRWLVWENVPGVLSSNGTRTFGTFLGMLAELGYGFAYRILDAQYCGVPQRRRRVFVVGYLGDWRRAAAVLFERASLRGDSAPLRQSGQNVAPTISARTKGGGGNNTGGDRPPGTDVDTCDSLICVSTGQAGAEIGIGTTLNCNHEAPYIAHSLRGEGFDASEDGAGRGTALVPVLPFDTTQITSAANYSNPKAGGPCHPLAAQAHVPCIAFPARMSGTQCASTENIAPSLGALNTTAVAAFKGGQGAAADSGNNRTPTLMQGMQVRHLTPRECTRLQGFPDDYLELKYADATQAHAVQVLHELWRTASSFAREGWRPGIAASLLTPQILLAGVHGGWLSWEVAGRCAAARRTAPGEKPWPEGFVRSLRINAERGSPPFGREPIEQCARELGGHLPILPYERASAEAALLGSKLWPDAQRTWPLRYAFATAAQAGKKSLEPDGPRYKALGNSMAVPVMRWIGERIAAVDRIESQQVAA